MLPIHERQTYGSNFRWVTESRLFHGGNTGSIPVRDAKVRGSFKILLEYSLGKERRLAFRLGGKITARDKQRQ